MKISKKYRIIPYTIFALLIDLFGRIMADKLMLPIRCDSIGTFLISYVAGPVCGGVVGFTNNIIYGVFQEQQSLFCIIGAIIGVAVGCFSKKKCFESQFRTVNLGMGIALFATVIAVIFQVTIYDGSIQNVWGNQAALMCINKGYPRLVSLFFGQFCVEILDKLISVEAVFCIIRLVRFKRKQMELLKDNRKRNKGRRIIGVFALIAALGLGTVTTEASAADTTETSAADTTEASAADTTETSAADTTQTLVADGKTDYDSYLQKIYTNEDGLLPGEANDIEQTTDGKLWIATYAGLYKYDGNKFKLLNELPTVKSVICLHTDDEGRLWVGTNDNGISIVINEQVVNTIDETEGLLSNSIKDITSDSYGNYYIGTADGMSIVTLNGGVKVVKNYEQIKNAYHMTSDHNGNVVVSTDRGEVYWLRNGEVLQSYTDAIQQEDIKGVCFIEDGRLLMGSTSDIVYEFEVKNGLPQLQRKEELDGVEAINSFYVTDNGSGDIFVCSDNGIAVLHNNYTYSRLKTDEFSSTIYSMQIDYQGNLWFCSSRKGLLKMSKSPFQELFPQVGVEADVVNTTERWQDLLFCGTDNGLVIINESDNIAVENEITDMLADTRIRCIKADSKGNLWIATTGRGICRIDADIQDGFKIRMFTEDDGISGMRFRSILEAQDGRIIVSGDYGITIINGDTVEKVYTDSDGFTNEKTLCTLEYKGALYVGSDGGGISVIKDGQITEHIEKKDGLSSDVILRMIYESESDGILIVTSNGLCYMDSDGDVSWLDRFPYSNNYDVICRNGTCWILGSAGIYVAKASDLIRNTRTEYPIMDTKKGLRSSLTANAWLCRDGDELYLCSGTGTIKINMSNYDITAKSYRILLDSINVDGTKYSISRSDVLKIPSKVEKITFEPEILNYSVYDPYVSYYLEGYDSGATECLLSEFGRITYPDLKSGRYVFHIAILDGLDGSVMESASYTIEKELEMYQNTWFRAYVMFIVGLVIAWITWCITRLRAQKTILKQQYELEYAQKQIEMSNETILSIARTVDAKDANTSQHSYRVSEYSVAIARRLGYPEKKCESLRQMALLHDIGKIGIPDAILNKPGRLTDEEFAIMKSHVVKGGEILKDFKMIENVDLGALYHHEKYDGTGYCHGLKGEEIPIEARIIGIADAFDAMTANRVYRKQLDIDFVIGELKRCSGTQFDPELVEIMLSLIDDGTINVTALYEKSKEDGEYE